MSEASTSTKSPSDFLNTVLGKDVVVRLNSGVDYKGQLVCLDSFMNLAMEGTEEFEGERLKAKYGDAFLRGNNVYYISTSGSEAMVE